MTGFEIIFQDRGLLMTISVGLIGWAVGALLPAVIWFAKDENTKKQIYTWVTIFSGLLLPLGIVGMISAFFLGGTPPEIGEERPAQEIEGEKPIDFDKLIELLQNEGYTGKRLTLLNKHSEIIPSQLSVGDLKRILKRFYGNDKRLEVIKVLRNLRKLKKSYTEIERSEIRGMFNNHRWYSEVEKWFDGSQ